MRSVLNIIAVSCVLTAETVVARPLIDVTVKSEYSGLTLAAARELDPMPVTELLERHGVAKILPDSPNFDSDLMTSPIMPIADIEIAADRSYALTIGNVEGVVTAMPAAFSLANASDEISVRIPRDMHAGTSFFVRDDDIVGWDQGLRRLTARKPGNTELYVIAGGKLAVVKIGVGGHSAHPTTADSVGAPGDLEFDSAMADIGSWPGAHAVHGRTWTNRERWVDASMSRARGVGGAVFRPQGYRGLVSLAHSTGASGNPVRRGNRVHYLEPGEFALADAIVRVYDDRSDSQEQKLFPLPGAKVRIVGSEIEQTADASGRVNFVGLPANSSMLVTIDDPYGRAQASVAELILGGDGETTELAVKMQRHLTAVTLFGITGAVQRSEMASICFDIASATGPPDDAVPDFQVEVDVDVDGPYYFNRFGFLDMKLSSTKESGKVCMLNVAPGPLTVTVRSAQHVLGNVVVPLLAGRHVERSIDVEAMNGVAFALASAPTAFEFMGSDQTAVEALRPLTGLTFAELGSGTTFDDFETGIVETPDARIRSDGSKYFLSQNSEFEQVLYAADESARSDGSDDEGPPVIPLFPKGFIDDISYFAHVPMDPDLGTVMVEHQKFTNEDAEPVVIHLLDEQGREVAAPWHFSDAPKARAMFFNVPVGVYTVSVESSTGAWLASRMVVTFSETLSYVGTGRKTRERW